jgi:hypothetical protein
MSPHPATADRDGRFSWRLERLESPDMPESISRRALLCVAVLVQGVAIARAQTQPTPELPRPAEPATSPDPASRPADVPGGSSRPSPWDYALGLGLGWESNVGLDTGQGPSDFTGRLRGNLAYALRKPKGEIRIAGDGAGYFYAEQTQFNRADGSLSVQGSRRFSPETRGSLGMGASYSHSDSTTVLIDQGLLLPLTRTIAYSADVGMDHLLSPRTTIRGAVRGYLVQFPDSDAYQDGNSLRFSLGLDRRIDAEDTIGLESSAERADLFGGSTTADSPGVYWTYYLSSQWTHAFSPRTATLLEAGTSYTPEGEAAGLGRTWSFYGGAGISRRVRRTRWTAYYRREVLPAFGLGGLRSADRVGLSVNAPLGRTWDATFGGNYSREAASSSSGQRLGASDAYATIGARLSRRLRLSAEGRYLRRSAYGPYLDTDALRVGLFLTLVPPTGGGERR